MKQIIIEPSPKFDVLYNLPKDTSLIILTGGRGGMKTHEASKWIAFQSTIKKKRCVILRDEKSLIRESILNEVLMRYDTANESGVLAQFYERMETGIKDLSTNEMLVFTKGFRASGTEKTANLKSISNVDYAIIEEAEDLRDVDRFSTFADGIRKEGSIIILILNTPSIQHWVTKRYFNTLPITLADVPEMEGHVTGKEIDGYFKLTPRDLSGFVCIQTSFKDNPYLPTHINNNYNAYGDKQSNTYDLHYYLTAIKGFASTGRKGQVLRKVKPIKRADYLKLPFKEFYGQDFGTASPAGMVGVKFDKNNCYARQLNYLPMNTLEIAKLYCSLKLSGGDRIIADNADEKAWRKLKRGYTREELPVDFFSRDEKGNEVCKYPGLISGFHVVPCVKGPDSITYGLSLMDSMNLFVVEEDKEFWEEINNYIYAQDKYGNYTNDPVDEFNHLIDPWRYVVNDQRGKRKFTVMTG